MLADGVTSIAAVTLVAARQNKWIMLKPLTDDEKQFVYKAPVRADPAKTKRMWSRLSHWVFHQMHVTEEERARRLNHEWLVLQDPDTRSGCVTSRIH